MGARWGTRIDKVLLCRSLASLACAFNPLESDVACEIRAMTPSPKERPVDDMRDHAKGEGDLADWLRSDFRTARVLITGHTGFKGSWLCEWLLQLGCEVWGFSLPPPTNPALFNQLGLAARMHHCLGDVRDSGEVFRVMDAARPDYVFHLAAQPLVREAYADPAAAWSINTLGTVHVLEALRRLKNTCACVVVTTDKVYGELTTSREYTEGDPIAATDPYGSSKAAAELAVDAWRVSFFDRPHHHDGVVSDIGIATARAGNVIGGGDWAKGRLLPDCVRFLMAGAPIEIRNPHSIRPWQHVLEPLSGYLKLAAGLRSAQRSNDRSLLSRLSRPFNFGPHRAGHRPVREVVELLLQSWPGSWTQSPDDHGPREASALELDITRANEVLGWKPRWTLADSIHRTVNWYRSAGTAAAALELTRQDIAAYQSVRQ